MTDHTLGVPSITMRDAVRTVPQSIFRRPQPGACLPERRNGPVATRSTYRDAVGYALSRGARLTPEYRQLVVLADAPQGLKKFGALSGFEPLRRADDHDSCRWPIARALLRARRPCERRRCKSRPGPCIFWLACDVPQRKPILLLGPAPFLHRRDNS